MLISNKTQTAIVTLLRFAMNRLRLTDAEFFPGRISRAASELTFRFQRNPKVAKGSGPAPSFNLVARRGTSDMATMLQILVNEHFSLRQLTRCDDLLALYSQIEKEGGLPLILDLGANVGYASRYFSEMYSRARVIAVEPVAENAAQARANNPDLGRVTVIERAVSCKPGAVKLTNDSGRMDAFMTAKVDGGADGPSTDCVTVNELLELARRDGPVVPFIAKIDIEGFESDLFAENLQWVDEFPLLIVELHDWMLPGRSTSRSFLQAVSMLDRDFVFYGEHVFSISNRMKSILDRSAP